MSAPREVIARASGLTEEECSCRYCTHHFSFVNDMLWCFIWDCGTPADSFCSFFDFDKDGDNT